VTHDQSAIFDPGLQPERTELAWRRTATAIAVGSLIALRLLPVALGHPAWIGGGVAGVLFAGWIWLQARTRFRRGYQVLLAAGLKGRPRMPGGGLMALTALAVFLIALTAVAVVLKSALA
jgi:hypothetical protein